MIIMKYAIKYWVDAKHTEVDEKTIEFDGTLEELKLHAHIISAEALPEEVVKSKKK
jgi:hypothetical protein